MWTWVRELTIWEKWALTAWVLVLVGIGVRVLLEPQTRTVYTIYSSSARLWCQGGELYDPHRPKDAPTGFRYSPTFAILAAPFAMLPDGPGGLLWRWFSTAVYLGGLAWWARVGLPWPIRGGQLAVLLLLILPLSLPSVSNGQANVLVIGTMLAAVAAVAQKRWNLATLFLGVAFVCKIYPLALGMLLAVFYPRQLVGRLVLMASAAVALPFFLQHPAYVLDQYGKWLACLRADDRSFINLNSAYRDLWLLVRLYCPGMPHSFYVSLQLGAGAGLAGLCWYRKRSGWPERALLTETLALAVGWMLLLGPATESCTFILLAPSLAWAGLRTLAPPRSWWHLGLVLTCTSLFLLNFLYAVKFALAWLPEATALHARGLHSWAALIWMLFLLSQRAASAAGGIATGSPVLGATPASSAREVLFVRQRAPEHGPPLDGPIRIVNMEVDEPCPSQR